MLKDTVLEFLNKYDLLNKTLIVGFSGGHDSMCLLDILSKIKELFFTTKVKGSGLGVSLSNEIIKAHNGTIDYTSKLGKGTKVVVKLPTTVI